MSDFDDELFALAGGDEEADVEEGEASSVAPGSPDSLGSGDMDESDSDRDDEPSNRNSDVPYPLEGKYIDSKDKARIQAMTQLEREAILGQRTEEMAKVKFQLDLRRKANEMAKHKPDDSRKRGVDSDDDDEVHESRRQTVKSRTNDKLEAYKREREQRDQQRQRHDDRRGARRRSSSGDRDGGSDADADGESDEGYEAAKSVPREDPPAAVNHFESVRVGRGFFSEVCFYPGFEDAMKGTYARVGAGQDSQRRVIYKMARIIDFRSGKPYAFEGKNGNKIATDQYVVCQYGSTKKEYQFQYLSNQRFTEADLDMYKQGLAETNAKLPTQGQLKKKYEDIKALHNRFWTDADINARIEKQKKFAHVLVGNKEDNPAPKLSSQSEVAAARIAEINRQNRKAEGERVRKALLEERKEQQRERKRREQELQRKKREEEEAKKAAEEKALKKKHLDVDPLFDGDSSRASTPKPEKKKSERKGLPTFRKPKMEDDIIAAMDIGVEIDI